MRQQLTLIVTVLGNHSDTYWRDKVMNTPQLARNFATMSEKNFLSPERLKEVEAIEAAAAKLYGPNIREKCADSIYKCRKCKKNDVNFFQLQTRCAGIFFRSVSFSFSCFSFHTDEPMTLFFTCHNCFYKWKE